MDILQWIPTWHTSNVNNLSFLNNRCELRSKLFLCFEDFEPCIFYCIFMIEAFWIHTLHIWIISSWTWNYSICFFGFGSKAFRWHPDSRNQIVKLWGLLMFLRNSISFYIANICAAPSYPKWWCFMKVMNYCRM